MDDSFVVSVLFRLVAGLRDDDEAAPADVRPDI
jgi:hypothetical protein